MANQTIKDLNKIISLSGENIFPLYHNLSTYSTQLSNIETFIVNNINLNKRVSAYFDPNIKYSIPLSDNTVITTSISSKSVTNDKLADSSIDSSKLSSNSITSEKISANAVTSEKLAINSITSEKILANAVTSEKLATNSITTEKISANAITSDKLAANSVTKEKLGDIVKSGGGLSKDINGLSLDDDSAMPKFVLVYDGANWVPRQINISDFSFKNSSGDLYPQNASIMFDAINKNWIVSEPETTVIIEQSYIRSLASCTQAVGNYAAITNDNRLIAWGTLNKEKFGGAANGTTVASSNVRVPFWNNYDGYKNDLTYSPYGGDYLDENKYAVLGTVLWNAVNGTSLVYTEDDISKGADVWVCGTNGGIASAAYADPTSIAISNDGDGYVITENNKSTQSTLTRMVPEIDFRDMNALSAVPKSKHIIANKYTGADASVTPNISLSSVKEQYFFSYAYGVKFVDSLGNIQDIAGSPTASTTSQKGGYARDSENGSTARFSTPDGIAQAPNGKIYVCDTGNHNIKRIANTAIRNTKVIAGIFAENGATIQTGNTDGGTTDARFDSPRKIVIDPTNHRVMYVSDSHRIRKLTVTPINEPNELWDVTTVAGFSALGGIVNGIGTVARFNTPTGLALSTDGKVLYIADKVNKCIRTFNTTTSAVDTFVSGQVNTAATLNNPHQIVCNATKDTLYVASNLSHNIRKIAIDPITKAGIVTALVNSAGTAGSVNNTTLSASTLNGPLGLTMLNNKLYITENTGNRIRMVDFSTATPTITTVAGTGTATSTDNLTGIKGTVYSPYYMTNDGTFIYFTDYYTHKIRRIDPRLTGTNRYALSTIAGTGTAGNANSVSAIKATFNGPTGIAYDSVRNCLYVSDHLAHTIRRIALSAAPYAVTTIAGNNGVATPDYVNSDIGLNARFNNPLGLKVDGNYLYVSDNANHAIRRITLDAPYKVETIIGTKTAGTKFGNGAVAQLNAPSQIEIIDGTMYIPSRGAHLITKASTSNPYALSSFVGTNNTAGNIQSGVATINWEPTGLVMDDNNILYFTDTLGDQVGSIDTNSANKEISFFKKFGIGNMGIGAKTDKPTSGFIKTSIVENGVEVRFKSVKRNGNTTTTVLFAGLDVNDSLWVWGTAFHGAFGIGHGAANASVTLPPTKVKRFSGQIKDYQISCSDATSSVITIITKDNKMYAAGSNVYGQLARNYTRVQATHTHREFKFEECLKNVSGNISAVADANSLADVLYAGTTNNFYIDTSGQVWACGNNTNGLLANGTATNVNETTFTKINDLSNVKKLIINGKDKPIAFALTNDGKIFSWGYNGAAKGQTLTNDIILANINKPTRCWNYDKKSEVDNAVDIFTSDNIVLDQALIAYTDTNKYVYFGGYKADVLGPDFPDNIPYFKRFNVKNVTNDILISGEEAFVHRENGTVFQVRSIGPQKLF